MSRIFKKRRLTLIIGVVASLAVAAAAFGYFTTTGSGSGSATVGTSSSFTVTQTSTISGLVPGGAPKPLTFTVSSPSDAGSQHLDSIAVTVDSVTTAGGAAVDCDADDFAVTDADGIDETLDGGDSVNVAGAAGASIALTDTGLNQDDCKDAVVHLSYSAE